MGPAHAARLGGPPQLPLAARQRGARGHRGPHPRLQRHRRVALGHARPGARRRPRPPGPRLRLRSRLRLQRVRGVVGRGRAPLDVDPRRRRRPAHRRAARAPPAHPELARRSGRGADHARPRQRLEDHRLLHGHLPRRPPGRPALAPRGGRPRRRRPLPALRPRHLAAPPPQRRVRRHHQPDPLVPGVRRGAGDDAGRPGQGYHHLRVRHLRGRLRQPAGGPRQRARGGLLRAAPGAHRLAALGLPARLGSRRARGAA